MIVITSSAWRLPHESHPTNRLETAGAPHHSAPARAAPRLLRDIADAPPGAY